MEVPFSVPFSLSPVFETADTDSADVVSPSVVLPRVTSPASSNTISRTLILSELVPLVADAATLGPGESGTPVCPSPWARWRPGLASSLWQEVLEKGEEKKEKLGKMDDDDLWETVLIEDETGGGYDCALGTGEFLQ